MKESKAKKRGTIAVKIDALVLIMVILSNIICLSVLFHRISSRSQQ